MEIRIALAGNPNSGKTTLFNALTGAREYVGNRAGVTVDKKEAYLKSRRDVKIIDLPGVYSLTVYSPEERAAMRCLLYERPDVIVNVADATNLRRNLYLTTQLAELGIPMVIALNKMDEAEKNGEKPDIASLSEKLGCAVIGVSAMNGAGVPELAEQAIKAARSAESPVPPRFCECVESALGGIERLMSGVPSERRRMYAIRLFERDDGFFRSVNISDKTALEKQIKACEDELGDPSDSIIAAERYLLIDRLIKRCCKGAKNRLSVTRKIDRVFANGIPALLLFAVIMTAVYTLSITLTGRSCAALSGGTETLRAGLENALISLGCSDQLISLISDGMISGVGSVLNFVPQLFVLFLLLAFLEECGYMSRIAFILDRIFRRFGMSGKSVIPLIIGSGCGAVGISAARTIENDSCRRMSVITTTFVPCSAKLPMISLIAANFFDGAWWTAPAAYFIGVGAALLSGLILKNTRLFAGESAPFIMELPAYRLPEPKKILGSAWERVWGFIKKAGTVILLSSIAIRAGTMLGVSGGEIVWSADLPLSESVLGKLSGALCPLFAPLGFGEPAAVTATIMGLAAKEEIVAVLGITDFSGLTPLAGFSFMVFNLLCAPCVAAIAAIRREMGSAKWTAFAVGYQCAFAYAAALVIYRIGRLLTQ